MIKTTVEPSTQPLITEKKNVLFFVQMMLVTWEWRRDGKCEENGRKRGFSNVGKFILIFEIRFCSFLESNDSEKDFHDTDNSLLFFN